MKSSNYRRLSHYLAIFLDLRSVYEFLHDFWDKKVKIPDMCNAIVWCFSYYRSAVGVEFGDLTDSHDLLEWHVDHFS